MTEIPPFSTHKRPHNPPWLRNSAVIVAVASAAVILFAVLRGPKPPEASGSVRASERETVTLGARGVAVAEPGAALDWRVVGAGKATIEQAEGSVFYRVDGRAPFVVATPSGEIAATGTCFAANVTPARVSVTVFEGAVKFSNAAGDVEVSAGHEAVAQPNAAPRILLHSE